jgi:hypothetical protein
MPLDSGKTQKDGLDRKDFCPAPPKNVLIIWTWKKVQYEERNLLSKKQQDLGNKELKSQTDLGSSSTF